MAILVTDLGLGAITDANAGGFLVNLTDFAVTEAQDVELKIDDPSLKGEPVFRGQIESIEVVSSSTLKLTLYLPVNVPREGTWSLTELGLYLKTGELFAHGTFRVAYSKEPGTGLRVFVFVSASRLGAVINVTLGTNSSLASTANVRSLIAPQKSATNAIIVQDGATTDENSVLQNSGTLAVRYGAGGVNWAFMGCDQVFHGGVDSAAADKFTLNVQQHGFWINDAEVLIAQAVSGHGAGESRRVQFNAQTNTFTVLEKNFSSFASDSVINLWRSTRHQLPTRQLNIDRNFVLGAGVNTWHKVGAAEQNNSSDLIPVKAHFVGDGSKLNFSMPLDIPRAVFADVSKYMVFVGGVLLPRNQYGMSIDGVLTLLAQAPAQDVPVEVVCYKTQVSDGSYLTFASIEYDATGTDWSFYTSIIPDNADFLLVFLDGTLVASDQYIYAGTSVTFTKSAPVGKLALVQAANYQEFGASTKIVRKDYAIEADVPQLVFDQISFVEKKNTLVMLNGQYVSKDSYDVDVNVITLHLAVTPGMSITTIAYVNEAAETEVREALGINTGPVWADPAGVYLQSNKIIASRVTYVGNGATRMYSTLANADFAMVFIDGLFQDPTTIALSKDAATLTLPDNLASAQEMDVIAFQVVEDDGEELSCTRYSFTAQANVSAYDIPPNDPSRPVQVRVVSIGGVYAHASSYDIVSGRITFKAAVPADLKVEIWSFISIPHNGFANAISFAQFALKENISNYVHKYADAVAVDDVGNENNTLLFGSTVLQMGSDYNVSNDDAYKFVIPGITTEKGVIATSLVFLTGKSKTRLITRAEMAQRYMTRAEMAQFIGASSAQAQAVSQPARSQVTVNYTGPIDPAAATSDPSANPVLQMAVTVSGTQPLLVWGSWSVPGTHESTAADYDSYYFGKYWKNNTADTECVAVFTLTGPGGTFKTEYSSNSVIGTRTASISSSGIFNNVPAGTYTLSLCFSKATVSGVALESFAVRGATMSMLETKR